MPVKMTKEEKAREQKWMAEDDARIMARYQEIMQDKPRMNRAIKEAKEQASRLQKQADTFKKVSKKK